MIRSINRFAASATTRESIVSVALVWPLGLVPALGRASYPYGRRGLSPDTAALLYAINNKISGVDHNVRFPINPKGFHTFSGIARGVGSGWPEPLSRQTFVTKGTPQGISSRTSPSRSSV